MITRAGKEQAPIRMIGLAIFRLVANHSLEHEKIRSCVANLKRILSSYLAEWKVTAPDAVQTIPVPVGNIPSNARHKYLHQTHCLYIVDHDHHRIRV